MGAGKHQHLQMLWDVGIKDIQKKLEKHASYSPKLASQKRADRSKAHTVSQDDEGAPVSWRFRTQAWHLRHLKNSYAARECFLWALTGTGLTPNAKANSEQKWMQLCPQQSSAHSGLSTSDVFSGSNEEDHRYLQDKAYQGHHCICPTWPHMAHHSHRPPGQFAANLPRMR